MVTKFDNYSDNELIHIVDNLINATELELTLAERLDMRLRDIEEMKHEKNATQTPTATRR